jgi:hypothetical protein
MVNLAGRQNLKTLALLIVAFWLGDYRRCIEIVQTAAKNLKFSDVRYTFVLYPVQTMIDAQTLRNLDRACGKTNLSRYEFLREALMEKIEGVRKTSS